MTLKTALYLLCAVVFTLTMVQIHDALKAEEQRLTWAARV